MQGDDFDSDVEAEADRFFNFNFPAGTNRVTNLEFTVAQDENSSSQLNGSAGATVPTSLMRVFNYDNIPVSVDCDATRDMGYNDIVLVLDVTGSMADSPSSGGSSKISRLQTGAMGLFRALQGDDGSVTRTVSCPIRTR